MTMQEVKRKLTAILSVDVKGYSRPMGEDEEGTAGSVEDRRVLDEQRSISNKGERL